VSLLTFLTLTKIAQPFLVTLNERDLTTFVEKVRSDIESLANVSKDTPVSSISHDLSLRYMNDMDTISFSGNSSFSFYESSSPYGIPTVNP